jgi:hypothetical protein
MQHGYAKIARNRALCRNPGGDRRSGASDHELADDLRRGRRRPCGPARGLRTRRDSADGGNTSRRWALRALQRDALPAQQPSADEC